MSSGARPTKGKAMAIAEWPTENGPADYALFVGLACVGVIEAKRKRKNVSAAIDQAERYSRGFSFKAGEASRRALGRLSRAVSLRDQWPPLSQADRNRERHLVPRRSQAHQSTPRPHRLADARRVSRASSTSTATQPTPP